MKGPHEEENLSVLARNREKMGLVRAGKSKEPLEQALCRVGKEKEGRRRSYR